MSDQQIIYSMVRVGKVVPPNRQILGDISLGFYHGAKIGVLGLNGAGKSTLLRIMAGQDEDHLGETHLAKGYSRGLLAQEPDPDVCRRRGWILGQQRGPEPADIDQPRRGRSRLPAGLPGEPGGHIAAAAGIGPEGFARRFGLGAEEPEQVFIHRPPPHWNPPTAPEWPSTWDGRSGTSLAHAGVVCDLH